MQESAGKCRRVQVSTGNCENHLFISQGESRHINGVCKGEVGEEGVQGGKTTRERERERRGLGSDLADSVLMRERREGAAAASWQVGE